MSAKRRGIHITTDGFEYDRVIVPIMTEYPVEELVILRNTDKSYTGAWRLAGHFVEKIKDSPIKTRVIETNIYDFNEVLKTTRKLLDEYSKMNLPIYINISSMPKLSLVAVITAALLKKERSEIEVFYVKPEEYLIPRILDCIARIGDDECAIEELKEIGQRFKTRGGGAGMVDSIKIPLFPITQITDLDKNILSILADTGGTESISQLVEILNKDRKDEVKRSTVQYRLDRLEKYGLVIGKRENKRLKLELTNVGSAYLF